MNTRHCLIDTALGELTLVADGSTLIGLYFPEHWHLPKGTNFGPRVTIDTDMVFARTAAQLAEYLDGDRADFDLPIGLRGTPAQQRIWTMLREIPYGETVTYGELAATLGDTGAWEVGQTVGRNPISIVVPCHRVVGKDGRLTGYAGGLARKRLLLEREERQPSRLF